MRSCKHSIDLPVTTLNIEFWLAAFSSSRCDMSWSSWRNSSNSSVLGFDQSWSVLVRKQRQITIKHTALSKLNVVILSSFVLTADVFWFRAAVSMWRSPNMMTIFAIVFLNTTRLHDFVVCDNVVTIIYAHIDVYCNSYLFVLKAVQWFAVYRIDNVTN